MTSGSMKYAERSKRVLSSSGILSTVCIFDGITNVENRGLTEIIGLAYGQMTNNLTSQAATMELHGVPNDLINNLDPLALIIFIPIMDQFIYPGIRRMGFNFTPLKKIYFGYMLASMSMIAAAVTQYYIYKMSPCGDHPSDCDSPAPINVWVQTLPYVLIAFSEIFTSITGYEYAFTKAPKNMKSLGMSLLGSVTSSMANLLLQSNRFTSS